MGTKGREIVGERADEVEHEDDLKGLVDDLENMKFLH